MERIYKRRDKRRYKRKNKRYRSNRNDSKIKEMIIYHIKENIAIYVIFLSIFAFGLIEGQCFNWCYFMVSWLYSNWNNIMFSLDRI